MENPKELEKQLFAHILKELGIDIRISGKQKTIATNTGTKEDHIELLAIMLSLQQRLFDLSLKINSAVFNDLGSQSEFGIAKRLHDRVILGLDIQFNDHMELLLDKNINTFKEEIR